MPYLILILLVLAFVLFALAGLGVPYSPPSAPARWNFIGWGLACMVLAEILARGPSLLKG